jgi:phosphoribosyl 1,2-cyclic phosphate phosphodiesterase
MGYGDFYRVQKSPPVYAAPQVMEYCSPVFDFLIREKHPVPVYTPFSLFGIEFILVEVIHPPVYTCGVVFSDGKTRAGYTSDTNEHIPERTRLLLTGLDLLLIDGLFPSSFKKVEKHLNYEEAVEIASELKAKDFRVVHMSHYLRFDLPHQGYDGEKFVF